ncbi:MAG TPA: M56 family metallopeptidase [Terriglobales bacterium]|nr:M56 family metallopeptidase [Terriglobales bacterium]
MFALRLVGVALSVFILAYCALSLAVSAGWKLTAKLWRPLAPSRSANFLLGLRLIPLAVSVAVTTVYAVPSFLLLEPDHIEEPLGPMLVLLAAGSLAWLLTATFRAIAAQKRTSRLLSRWVKEAKGIEKGTAFPVLRLPSRDPVLTVAGICAPKVLVSETAVTILTAEELEAALRHEMAHIRRHDNLKKLLFRFASFPAMGRLESAWSEMSEMAADDAAISNSSEALDLASALIKLSRFAPVQPSYAMTSALLPGTATSLAARVRRLFNWTDPQKRETGPFVLPLVLVIGFLAVLTYGPLLTCMHAMTEWLVR